MVILRSSFFIQKGIPETKFRIHPAFCQIQDDRQYSRYCNQKNARHENLTSRVLKRCHEKTYSTVHICYFCHFVINYYSAATTLGNCKILSAFCSLNTRWEKSRFLWFRSMSFSRSAMAILSSSMEDIPALADRKSRFGLVFESRKMASQKSRHI